MAYMDGDAVFADGIQELSFDEIEAVGGAFVFALVPLAIAAASISIGWVAAHNRED